MRHFDSTNEEASIQSPTNVPGITELISQSAETGLIKFVLSTTK